MLPNKIGLSAVGLSAMAAIGTAALPSAVAQSSVKLTPKQAALVGVSIAPPLDRQYDVGTLIVKLRAPNADLAHAMASANMRALSVGAGVRMKNVSAISGGASLVALDSPVPLAEARELAARLSADPSVEYAVPDIVLKPAAPPNDTDFVPRQWNWLAPDATYSGAITVALNAPPLPDRTALAFGGISMVPAWELQAGTNAVVVAIIDTGIINHPELNGSNALTAYQMGGRFLQGHDFVSTAALGLAGNFVENDLPAGGGRDADPTDTGGVTTAAFKNANAVCDDIGPTSNRPFFDTPPSWHGTRSAGIIAATADNNSGIAGITSKAPNIRILPVRAMGRCGGNLSDVADAIRWSAGIAVAGVPANANPAKVISIGAASAPATACPAPLQDAITAAIGEGATVVAATGNNFDLNIGAPANCTGVIAVTAHAINGETTQYANIGPESKAGPNPTISAPSGGIPSSLGTGDPSVDNPTWAGFSIWSTARNAQNQPSVERAHLPLLATNNAAYGMVYSGTSDATAQVAGVAALILAKRPTVTPAQMREILTASARPFPSAGLCAAGNRFSGQCGAGMLDAVRALQATDPPVIVSAPVAVTVGAGQTATFTVEATGVTSYQWTRAGADIAGATSATYTILQVTAADNNVPFAVKMTNVSGTVTSPPAVLTVSAGSSANAPASGGGGALPFWQLLLMSSLLLAARVRVGHREH